MKGKWTLRILGVTWGPDQASHCHSDRFTAPDWDLRGAEEEVLRLRLATCVTIVIQVARLRWPSTDWLSAAWLPQSNPSCCYWFLMQHRKSRRSVLRMSPRIGRSEESMFHVAKTELLTFSVKASFFLPSLPPPGPIWNIPWCLVSDLQLACPVTSAHYCCISLRPLLNEDWDKAGSEWTVWSRRPEAGAPRSNVPPKYLSAS